ncbi:MAG: Uma2 family endonuclease [Acidobacteria bacterium]|nr:Uma2 family endonuclease [Acidobacteriota bacterium]
MSTVAPILPPPLREGDRLSREEFLRRWEAMPDLKHAELLDGVVYMPSPVGYPHNATHLLLSGWLFNYIAATDGCNAGSEGTWLMGPADVPQPDLTMRLLPDRGGRSTIVKDLLSGVPELVVEVSHSSASRDLGVKSDLYLRYGVREYLVVVTKKQDIVWREVVKGRYRRIQPGEDGIFRSRVFPGLWLDAAALWKEDTKGLIATLNQGLASDEHAEFIRRLAC